MKINFIKLAAVVGMLAVIFGAFGAHSLQDKISVESIKIFETGVRYHFYHCFAILFVGLYQQQFSTTQDKLLRYAGWAFFLGILLFSGSLYLLACRSWFGIAHWKFLGPLTPIGGLCFIIGWVLLFFQPRPSDIK
ncbi:MAG: DUF423 domain-containing protein [Saprospiraceae bacterium]